MHQTDQPSTVECEITTWKSLICGFLEYIIINIDTQIVPLFFCSTTKVSSLVDSHSFIQETIKKNGWQMKERENQKDGFQ